jgi:site-specific DNA-cytosine methylase
MLSPRWLGDPQSRKRKFAFGVRGMGHAGIANRLPLTALEPVDYQYACTGGGRERPVKIGGSGKVKVGKKTLTSAGGALATNKKSAAADLARGQGFPELDLKFNGWTKAALCKAIGNGVPRIMGEAIAAAINEWLDEEGVR